LTYYFRERLWLAREDRPTKVSIIIPACNESQVIAQNLSSLQPLRSEGHELIVVDGGSRDDTVHQSRPLADRVISSAPGRARQMNAGARIATGDVLLFLHADTCLPPGAAEALLSGLVKHGRTWGRFDVRLSGKRLLFRVIAHLMNLRSRFTGMATGDQGIFVQHEVFEAVGGFPEIDLMEDIALSKILKRRGRPLCLGQCVETSSRRWEKNGVWRTVFLMWWLRLAYALGADPKRLAKTYNRLKDR
jgi:rSAM/selenodomain-associated transferase 2